MDDLFTPEILDKVLGLLDTATVMGGAALVVYFLVPLLMLLVTCTVWVWIIKLVVPALTNMIVRLNTSPDVDKVTDRLAARIRADLAILLEGDEELQAKLLAAACAGATHEAVFKAVLDEAGVESLDSLANYSHTSTSKLSDLFRKGGRFTNE